MTKYTRRLAASLFASAALCAFAACRGNETKADSTALGADTTLNRDLAMANRGDTNAQPQLKDVPANAPSTTSPNAPVTKTEERRPQPRVIHRPAQTGPVTRAENKPAPAPVPTTTTTKSGNTETRNPGASANPGGAGGGAVGMIAAGTTLNSHANSKICTNTNQVGDHVTATIDNAVSGSNGATIPAGATLNLTVTQLKRSENANDAIVMEFAVNSVTFGGHTYPIDGTVTSAAVDRIKDQPQGKDVQKVAIGAAAGAVLGHILGHSTKATVIGGAAGAAAGAATASATANYQGCVQSGGSIVVKLTSAATVRV